jgi:uncharacterized membrane protein
VGVAADKFAKGGRRDLGQALANGGLGALLAVASWLWPHPAWLAAFAGAMAAVTADTWATEIGILSARSPRLITTLRPVPTGTSGGITWLGSLAALVGGLCIGLGAVALQALEQVGRASLPLLARALPPPPFPGLGAPVLLLAAALGGLVSAFFDSLLGATVQQVYVCEVCGKETERRVHHDRPTRPLRGWRWLGNDGVNFLASVVGAGIGGLVYIVWAAL